MSYLTDIAEQDSNIGNTIELNGLAVTNNSNVPKELALFAIYANTLYDQDDKQKYLSASDLIMPVRRLVYKLKTKGQQQQQTDVSALLASAKGTSHHSTMEQALEAYNKQFDDVAKQYIIEERFGQEFGEWTIAGKFDMLTPEDEDGYRMIKDLKHVSGYVYKQVMEEKDVMEQVESIEESMELYPHYTKFQLQLSIYAYLARNKYKLQPFGEILFMLSSKPSFGSDIPNETAMKFPLLPAEEVEAFMRRKIALVEEQLQLNEPTVYCTDKERMFRPGEYKLQRLGPSGKWSTVRGSKFDNLADFQRFVREKGRPGDQEFITEPTYLACEKYCQFSEICDQYQRI